MSLSLIHNFWDSFEVFTWEFFDKSKEKICGKVLFSVYLWLIWMVMWINMYSSYCNYIFPYFSWVKVQNIIDYCKNTQKKQKLVFNQFCCHIKTLREIKENSSEKRRENQRINQRIYHLRQLNPRRVLMLLSKNYSQCFVQCFYRK